MHLTYETSAQARDQPRGSPVFDSSSPMTMGICGVPDSMASSELSALLTVLTAPEAVGRQSRYQRRSIRTGCLVHVWTAVQRLPSAAVGWSSYSELSDEDAVDVCLAAGAVSLLPVSWTLTDGGGGGSSETVGPPAL
jgi:hypothetical protein